MKELTFEDKILGCIGVFWAIAFFAIYFLDKNNMGTLVLLLFVVPIYFLPAIIGKEKRNAGAIFALNLFLGWTLLGWVIALVWALTKDTK